MQIIDNINITVKENLQSCMHQGSELSVAAACFSIYAYQELKKQLDSIDELRFIFTSPTFVTEKASKAQREFYIPRISRERSLYGNEFRLDLLEYMKQHEDIETAPKGLHTVVGQTEDSPAGVIFVLRNINDSVNIDNRNRIHLSIWSTSAKRAKLSAITSTRRNCSTRCVCSAVARASLVRSFAGFSMMRRMTDAKWVKSLSY